MTIFFYVCVMYSGEYDVCDITLSVYPHRASLKNMLEKYAKGRRFDSHRSQAGIFFKLARCGYTLRGTSQISYLMTLREVLCHQK